MTRLYTEDECKLVAHVAASNALYAIETQSGEPLKSIVDRAIGAVPIKRALSAAPVAAPDLSRLAEAVREACVDCVCNLDDIADIRSLDLAPIIAASGTGQTLSERLARLEAGQSVPGTSLQRSFKASGGVEWVLGVGQLHEPKAFYRGDTVEECLRADLGRSPRKEQR